MGPTCICPVFRHLMGHRCYVHPGTARLRDCILCQESTYRLGVLIPETRVVVDHHRLCRVAVPWFSSLGQREFIGAQYTWYSPITSPNQANMPAACRILRPGSDINLVTIRSPSAQQLHQVGGQSSGPCGGEQTDAETVRAEPPTVQRACAAHVSLGVFQSLFVRVGSPVFVDEECRVRRAIGTAAKVALHP